jgi:hypothetical protein
MSVCVTRSGGNGTASATTWPPRYGGRVWHRQPPVGARILAPDVYAEARSRSAVGSTALRRRSTIRRRSPWGSPASDQLGIGSTQNWVKNFQVSLGNQVVRPFTGAGAVEFAPSAGLASCPPSKATHSTGWPAEQPA